MKILQDNDIIRLLATSTLTSILVGLLFNLYLNSFVAIIAVVLIMLIFILNFIKKRNLKVEELQETIIALNKGDYELNFESFDEGELSILQSEIQKTMITLKYLNDTLEKKQLFLNQSLMDIAHQLKTPITSLILSNDILKDAYPNENHFLDQNEEQLNRLEWLVSSLLKHIRLEADGYTMHQGWVNTNDFIEEIRSHVQLDNKNHVDIEFIVVGESMFIDFKWFTEAVGNILSNKLRYANTKITVSINGSQTFTEVLVWDDGESIEVENRKLIFERFFKGSSSGSNSVGIGLAITKEIVLKHNGIINVVDQNTFRIKLFNKM